jgi:serine/threonine protein kinase
VARNWDAEVRDDGTWVLADFGLAKFIGTAAVATSFVTQTRMGWGTAYYAAPEQYRDFKRTDEKTDVYAAGDLLWELFSSGWPPPELGRPDLPKRLEEVFLRAVARDPCHRHCTIAELTDHFNAACATA